MDPIHKSLNPLYQELIQEVKKRESLWDPNNKLHRSRKGLRAWTGIAKKLNISEYAARTKWKMLRTIFQRHMKTYNPKSIKDYSGKWQYFSQLWFLHTTVTPENSRRKNTTESQRHCKMMNDEDEDNGDSDDSINDASFDNGIENGNDTFSNTEKKIKTGSIDGKSSVTESTDSDELFLRSLAPFLKLLDPVSNLVVRNRIHDILVKEIVKSEKKNVK